MSIKFAIRLKRRDRNAAPPVLARAEDLFFKGSNGCLVLLIHGLTGTPHEMKFMAQHLNEKGYSVACPRLANHGKSLSILKKTKWQDFYESAKKSFLEAGDQYAMVFVGGLSMGALLSLLLAEEFSGKIAGVSCLSPTLFYDGWNMPKYRWLLPLGSGTFLKHFFYFKEDPPYGIKNEAIRRYVHRYYSQAQLDNIEGVDQYGYPFFPLTLLDQLDRLVKHITPKLGAITTPVQLIQAKEDDMTSIKNSQFIYERIKSGQKELILLENSYHVITADQERDKVAQKMAGFFTGIVQSKETSGVSRV
jgi:carboxylesterase